MSFDISYSRPQASILIIDDIPQIHNFIAIHLKSENYIIYRATTGMEGLEIVQQERLDLILLDIGLPDITGFEVLQQVKADPRLAGIPIIILTIKDLTDNIVRALEMGAHDYITKPFEPAELRARVKSAIQMRNFQEKLEQSRRQYVTVVNNLSEVVFQLNLEYHFTFLNLPWQEISGYRINHSLFTSLLDYIHPEDQAKMRELFARLLSTPDKSGKLHVRLRTHQDTIVWVEVCLRPVHNEEQLVGIAGTLTDITQQVNAEQEIKLHEQRFRMLIENSYDVIFTVDKQGIVQYSSPSIYRVLGYDLKEMSGRSFRDIVHPDDFDRAEELLQETLQKPGNEVVGELHINHTQKETLFCEVVYKNLLGNSSVRGIIVTIRNITERKNAEQELLKRDSLLQGVAEAMTCLLTTRDYEESVHETLKILASSTRTDRIYIVENQIHPQTAKMLQIQRFEWIRESARAFVDSSLFQSISYADYFPRWYALLSQGKVVNSLVENAPKSERDILQSLHIRSILVIPIMIEQRFWGFIGFDNCRTEEHWSASEQAILTAAAAGIGGAIMRKQVEKELIAAKIKAEEVNELKSAFIANMSHELRTPMVGVLGFASLLYNELDDHFHKSVARDIRVSGQRLLQTIDKILDLSRIEANNMVPQLQPVTVSAELQNMSRVYIDIAEQKGLSFEVMMYQEMKAELDPMLFRQIMAHVLDNAVKFTREGKVILEASKEHIPGPEETERAVIIIKVHDTGIGMSEPFRQHIFEPFRQESVGLARRFEGTGLGLTLVKYFVEKMNGTIFVESIPDQGTTITLIFPALNGNVERMRFA